MPRVLAGRLFRLAEQLQEAVVEDVLDERRLAGAADAGHTDEPIQRNRDVDVAQVVLARTADHESRIVLGDAARRAAAVDLELAAQVLRRQRLAVARERARASR